MKYIDAEKLIAEIKRRIIEHRKSLKKDITLISEAMLKGSLGAYESIERFITTLQQEQLVNKDLGTLIACDIIEMTAKKAIDKPQDKEKEEELMTRKINYLRSLEENYVQQEQPEVELEKAAEGVVLKLHPIMGECYSMNLGLYEMIELVKAGFELGLKARKEE